MKIINLTKPKSRTKLLAVRLSPREIKAFRDMCKSMQRKPCVQLRRLVLAWAGI